MEADHSNSDKCVDDEDIFLVFAEKICSNDEYLKLLSWLFNEQSV